MAQRGLISFYIITYDESSFWQGHRSTAIDLEARDSLTEQTNRFVSLLGGSLSFPFAVTENSRFRYDI